MQHATETEGWREGGMDGWRDGWREGWMDGGMAEETGGLSDCCPEAMKATQKTEKKKKHRKFILIDNLINLTDYINK